MSTQTRITEAYVADLAEVLTPREHELVQSLDRLRLASVKQLERLHFTAQSPRANARQARRTLSRLTHLRVVTRLARRIGGVRAGSRGAIYALDVAGQRLASACGPAGGIRIRRPWTPGPSFLAHHLAVTELYVNLVESAGRGEVELLAFDAEPAAWRTFTGMAGAKTVLKPDAFIRLGVGDFEDTYFIEVDRATHSGPSVARKLGVYRRYRQTGREQARWSGVFPEVLILVPSEARQSALHEVVGGQPAESRGLFRIALYREALAVLTGRKS